MESDSMRVAVSAGEAAGIVETVLNGCGRTPGGGPGRTGQGVGASAVPAKPGRGRGPDRDSVADPRRQTGGAVAAIPAAGARISARLRPARQGGPPTSEECRVRAEG